MTSRIVRAPEAPPLPPGRDVGDHHAAGRGFRDPWPPHPDAEARAGGFFRWMWDRLWTELPPDPEPAEVPKGTPEPTRPRAGPGEIRVTFVGHATLLIQAAGLNLLTDPIWTVRAGPFSLLGGSRFSEPGMPLDELPLLDGVLLSHGHYDHLDARTVELLRERFGPELPWYTPLGYEGWFAKRGVRRVVELDWWEQVVVDGPSGPTRIVCLPVRHWTRRGFKVNARLWCSWAVLPDAAPEGEHAIAPRDPGRGGPNRSHGSAESAASRISRRPRGVYFGGDSGWCPAFHEIGQRLGPFRAALLPIGAYEPRWFMAPSHMNPEEAVRAYRKLGGRGAFVGTHWGAFRLTDEDPLEPPERTRRAWREAGLPGEDLHLPGIGGTVVLR